MRLKSYKRKQSKKLKCPSSSRKRRFAFSLEVVLDLGIRGRGMLLSVRPGIARSNDEFPSLAWWWIWCVWVVGGLLSPFWGFWVILPSLCGWFLICFWVFELSRQSLAWLTGSFRSRGHGWLEIEATTWGLVEKGGSR